MSMNPGVTAQPDASSTRSPSRFEPISVIFPSAIATSAGLPGAPVPSTTVPPRMTMSAIDHELEQVAVGIARVDAGRGGTTTTFAVDRPLFDLRTRGP